MAATQRLSLARVRSPSLATVAVSISVGLMLVLAFVLNIWQDEAYTLQTTSRGIAYAFHQALAFEQSAPLYFLALTVWRHLNDSVFFLRLFSVLCAGLGVMLVPAIARRYLPRADPGLVTVSAAWNPFLIWAAVEMRPYALIVLMSSLLLVTFYDGFLVRRPGRWAAAAYAACAALALYAQYYLAFLIAAQAIAVIVYRRGALVRYAVAAGVAGLIFSPMLAIVPAQVVNFRGAFTAPASVFQSATILASIAGRYLFPLLVPHAAIVYLVLGVGVAAALIRFRRAFSPGGNGEILVVTAGAYALFACVAYAAGVHILNRHAASLYIPATLSVYAVLTFLYPRARRRAMLLWCAAAAIASSVALVQTYAQGAKPGDWLRASAYIRAHEHAGEPIVVFEAENALPFAFYYHGPNSVRAVPHAVDFHHYDLTRFVVYNEAELQAAMPRAHQLWFITAGECASANVSFGCDTVERFIAARYRTQLRASFYGSSVRLLRLERGGISGS